MRPGEHPPTNYRRQRRRSERQLLIAVCGTLVIIGGVLIGVFYGPSGLLAGLPCLLGGAGIILALHLFLVVVEWWVNR